MSKCPTCPGTNGEHKFSCPTRRHEAAMAHAAKVDWRQARSSGNVAQLYHAGVASYFDAPLISPVEGNLFQGGCENGVPLGDEFKTVVSLYPWERYDLAEGVERFEFKMYDSPDGVALESLVLASEAVLAGLAKGKTLVHCQAGLNRSGLVAAFTLMRLGKTAQEAIDLLRKQRSSFVLCNKTFVKQLHELQHQFDDGTLDHLRA